MRLAFTLLLLAACDTRGTLGNPCVVTGGLLNPVYSCNDPLVCNTALNRCEQLNQGGPGAACASDRVCRVELWCPPGLDAGCSVRITEGNPCPSGVGCQEGLRCDKTDAGIICVR